MNNYIVVGGTKGIGKEVVNQLIAGGSRVKVLARNEVSDLPDGAEFVSWDAQSENFPEIEWDIVDGVVYAPGTINLKPFGRLKAEDFISDYQINTLGAIKTIQAIIPKLKKADNPSVVLYSTVAVGKGMPYHTSVAAAKGAVEGLTRSLAAEFSPTIRFNCIAPSITDTPLAERILANEERKKASADRHPLKRVGNPSDIASMTVYLLGDSSTWITGQVFSVDGGMSSIGS